MFKVTPIYFDWDIIVMWLNYYFDLLIKLFTLVFVDNSSYLYYFGFCRQFLLPIISRPDIGSRDLTTLFDLQGTNAVNLFGAYYYNGFINHVIFLIDQ